MKNRIQLLAIVLILALVQAAPALAANNLLGVYADSTGTTACTTASGAITCYVVASNVDDQVGIAAWQFAMRIDAGGFIFAQHLPSDAINLESFPRMMVGCASPVASAPAVVLLSFSAYATGPASIFIEQLSPSDPVLLLLAGANQLTQAQYAYGGNGLPVFSMGGADCPPQNSDIGGVVAVERRSWGDVKSLFRH